MHNYHDAYGRLPPAVVYGPDGKPLYSWRVVLLPFVESSMLYHEFHLDEPWDSPHNIKLLPGMPGAYASPPGKRSLLPPNYTFFHVFHGKGAAFEDSKGQRLHDFTDGTSNTILIMEAGPASPWSKPEEFEYAPDKPLPAMTKVFDIGYRAAMADASLRTLPLNLDEATMRAVITRNGGEVVQLPWDNFGAYGQR